jgi:phosphoribosylformimino-5-aminoimidazole carboxamide ribotide isomerase
VCGKIVFSVFVKNTLFREISFSLFYRVNVEATASLAKQTSIPIIASGGITNIKDISKLLVEAHHGIMGAITGRAIYEGTLDFAKAQRLCDEH